MTVELPAQLLADWLSVALALACACVIEATLARHPALPSGAGLVAGALLLAWQWRCARRRPRRIAIGADGVAMHRATCGTSIPAMGPRARVLGRSVVLHWRDSESAGTAWLTPADLPREVLRAIRVRVESGRAASAS